LLLGKFASSTASAYCASPIFEREQFADLFSARFAEALLRSRYKKTIHPSQWRVNGFYL
jgi:hypothetical protein